MFLLFRFLPQSPYPIPEYPDFLLATMCPNCHSKSDQQEGAMKWPRNSRGDKAKPDNLENPRERQTSLDEF